MSTPTHSGSESAASGACDQLTDTGAAWVTNQKDSVNDADGRFEAVDETVPSVRSVSEAVWRNHRELLSLPLTRQQGRNLRPDCLDRDDRTDQVRPLSDRVDAKTARHMNASADSLPDDWETGFDVDWCAGKNPVTWGEAVDALLESHAELRETELHFVCGKPSDAEYATHNEDARGRFMPEYQRKYYAEMKGWFRELTGSDDRPSGERPDGIYGDDATVALVTRTASSVHNGYRSAPVDQWDEIRESWQDCYNTARNKFRARGYELGDGWQYDRRLEPHPGDGDNQCYMHEHCVMVVDGDVPKSAFRPIVEKHVESTPGAGRSAHDLDVQDWDRNADDVETVEIIDPNEIDDLAGYVCDYASVEPIDLLERSTDYIMFAAAAWASGSQTISRSDPATWASKADRCKQRYEHGGCDQDLDHGEELIRKEIRQTPYLCCAECGVPHGIDQSQTLVESRLQDNSEPELAADGGDAERAELLLEWEENLAERFPDARAVGNFGETPKRRKLRRKAEAIYDRNPDITVAALTGELLEAGKMRSFDTDQIRLLAREVIAGFDRCDEYVCRKRGPDWRLDAVSIDGDTHQVDEDAGGFELEATDLHGDRLIDWILKNTKLPDLARGPRDVVIYQGVRLELRDAAARLARQAGADRYRCRKIIADVVQEPSDANPRVDHRCWSSIEVDGEQMDCPGVYERQHTEHRGGRHLDVYECWHCGDVVELE